MKEQMQTVMVLTKLAMVAKDNERIGDFVGHLIGATAALIFELKPYDEEACVKILGTLSDVTLSPIESHQSTVQ